MRTVDTGPAEPISDPADQELDAFAAAPLLADRYAPLRKIGEGGMGQVFLAWDVRLERQVALKLLKRERHGDEAVERLLREARSMAQLSHPNVLPVHDVAEHEGRAFMVMEYVRGRTLRAWLAERPRARREIVGIFIAASRGLGAAHEAGFVHRDFKPDNVLVGADERPRVMDFGLVRPDPTLDLALGIEVAGVTLGATSALTLEGYVLGTPAYMAPEQHASEKADARADQYALCVSLWEALVGARPFAAEGVAALAELKGRGAPPAPEGGPGLPRSLVAALRRGLSPDPSARFGNMRELELELAREPKRRRRRIVLALAGVAAVGVLGVRLDRWRAEARRAASCAAAVAAVDDAWNHERRKAMGATMLASGASYAADTLDRTASRLDEYRGAWQETRGGLCEAEASSSELEARAAQGRVACLDAALDELEAFVDVLVVGDAEVVRHAVVGVVGLPAPSSCLDDAALPAAALRHEDPSLRAQRRALWRELARARALLRAHSLPEARAAAVAAHEHAGALALTDLTVEAQLLVGGVEEALGRFEEARASYQGAFVRAVEYGDERRMAAAARSLAYVEGARLADVEGGARWGAIARAGSARLGLLERPAAIELWLALAAVHQRNGHFAEMREATDKAETIATAWLDPHDPAAMRVLEARSSYAHETGDRSQALALVEEAHARTIALVGESHPDAALTLARVGAMLADAGRVDEAREVLERAVETQRRLLGPSAPLADTLGNLGRAYELSREPGRALARYREAFELELDLYGEHHPKVAELRVNLGNIHLMAGELDEAIALNERAREDLEAAFGPSHPSLGHVRHNLGVAYELQRDYAGALPHFRAAAELWTETLGPAHPMRARALAAVGNTMFNLERPAEAIEPYREALRVWSSRPGDDRSMAAARWMLAVALAQTDGDRQEARALALQARAYYAAHEGDAARVAEIDQWMPQLGLL